MGSMTRRRFLESSMLGVGWGLTPRIGVIDAVGATPRGRPGPAPASRSITVGVVQQAREPELAANRDKIVHFLGQARARDCRLVIFPEDALGSPRGTSNEDLEKTVDAIRDAARASDVYAIFCNMGQHPKGLDEPRHGHSAIIHPDGAFAAAADDVGDQMLVATLDLSKADSAEARRRHNHPVFKPSWDLGRRTLQGEKANVALPEPYTSPQAEITIAAAQMACSRDVPANLERMARLIGEAAGHRADVVAFPELVVTGAVANDIPGADATRFADAPCHGERRRWQMTSPARMRLPCGKL